MIIYSHYYSIPQYKKSLGKVTQKEYGMRLDNDRETSYINYIVQLGEDKMSFMLLMKRILDKA